MKESRFAKGSGILTGLLAFGFAALAAMVAPREAHAIDSGTCQREFNGCIAICPNIWNPFGWECRNNCTAAKSECLRTIQIILTGPSS